MGVKTALVAPRGMFFVDRQLVIRRVLMVPPEQTIRCWRTHIVKPKGRVLDGIAFWECDGDATGPCDLCVLVVEGASLVSIRADLTADEAKEMGRRRWRTPQIMQYLGVDYPESEVA